MERSRMVARGQPEKRWDPGLVRKWSRGRRERDARGIGRPVCHDDGELEQIIVVVSLSFRRGIFQSR